MNDLFLAVTVSILGGDKYATPVVSATIDADATLFPALFAERRVTLYVVSLLSEPPELLVAMVKLYGVPGISSLPERAAGIGRIAAKVTGCAKR